MTRREVVVTGLGAVTAFGHGMEALWDGLAAGRCVLHPSARMPEGLRDVPVGEVPPIDVRTVARSAMARRIDRVSLMTLAAARLAFADAALEGVADPRRTGMVLGSAYGNLGETMLFCERLHARGVGNALVFPNLVLNAPLSYASIELGITGPTAVVNERELSGETAIAHAVDLVADGEVDVCLAGGADELDPVLLRILADTGGLAKTGMPRAFDPTSPGPAVGEGGGVLVLESRAHAEARRARVYARVEARLAFGVASSLFGWPADGVEIARRLVPELATTDLVVTSACGEPARDRVLLDVIGASRRPTDVIATPQVATGTFGAAGAIDAAVAARAVADATVLASATASAVVVGVARGGVVRALRFERVAT